MKHWVRGWLRLCVLLSALAQITAWAHGDLQLQIEELDRRIEAATPPDAELYLRRGDLHRRHRSWAAAEADFLHARALDPVRIDIDWFEGRMRVEQGQLERGRELLSRFMESNGSHAGAFRLRAIARWGLGDLAGSAADYAAAVRATASPSPGMYRSWVIAEAASGAAAAARAAVDEGLERFSLEVSLLGLGADLALAAGEAEAALVYLDRLPTTIERLPQWRLRHSLADCVLGAALSVEELSAIENARSGSQTEVVSAGLRRLNDSAASGDCRQAAQAMLQARTP